MKLPVRKCYHAAKISFFLILVVTIITLFEHWRGGRRSTSAQVLDTEEEYEREILEDEARIIPGLGEGGAAAHLFGEAKRLGEESEKKLAINVYLSDRIAYNRTLKDHRNPACKRVVYDAELPSASIILIFHNEPYSVVVRTIWSVLNSARRDQPWYKKANFVNRETGKTMRLGYRGQDPNSKFVYIKEIILVDDNSTLPELKGKLSHYIRTRLPPDLIKILRLPDRQGLMRARITGARAARGDALVFLDAHCETGADWLRPLLQRLRHKRDSVLTPLIDVVDQTTFQLDAAEQFQVGGFTFMGHFTWIDVPEREKKRRGSDISPTWSPTMAGGLFAISRSYYWELGAYDEQMAGWGGENLEMSFRIWQCGGTLETIPCSRVGHVFRSFHPYGLPAHTDTHGINTARMAEVWMDDYAELFYLHRPDLRKNPKIGDVTHRKVLREKLKCKSFQWYLDNIYKEKFVPVRDVYGFGRFSNPATGLCLDTLQREGEAAPLGAYPCHARLEPTQHLALSLRGELRDEERCATVQYARPPHPADMDAPGEGEGERGRRVLMVTCHGRQRGQLWRYLPTQQLQHVESRLCLVTALSAGDDVTVAECRNTPRQVWRIDYSEKNGFRLTDDAEPSEQELRLRKLRGQRRISRSLLSYADLNDTRRHAHASKHRNKHKRSKKHKKSKKNKFVLKLLRNSSRSEEHLEVDVYCKHKRLYPNNTFVRDLVTILNEKNIKVINNGRVFEHNKVVELIKREHASDVATTPPSPTSPSPSPTTAVTVAEPDVEPKPPKKRKHKKHKVQPVNVINDNENAEMADNEVDMADNDKLPDADKMADIDKMADVVDVTDTNAGEPKKIIIEDFVEITTKVSKERLSKKKRKRVRTRPHPPATTTAPLQSRDDSIEDAPMWESAEARGGDSGETRVISLSRRNNSEQQRRGHADTSEEFSETSKPPVKVVMRSNLTFNFGDDFFKLKKTASDVANLIELIIPANISHTITNAQTDDADGDSYVKRERDRDIKHRKSRKRQKTKNKSNSINHNNIESESETQDAKYTKKERDSNSDREDSVTEREDNEDSSGTSEIDESD